MKKKWTLSLLILGFLLTTAFRSVVVPFEGTVRYETLLTGNVPKGITDRIAKYYDVRFKGSDLKISGEGPLKAEILTRKDLGKVFIIRRDEKNIYEMDMNDARVPADKSAPVVTRRKETVTIAGYVCQQYDVQYSGNITAHIWTTYSIQEADWGSGLFGGHFRLPDKVEGFPLKFEIVLPSFKMTGTATSVKYNAMDVTEFAVPSGLTPKKL